MGATGFRNIVEIDARGTRQISFILRIGIERMGSLT